MTTRYLMRLGKTPFEVADPYETLERNRLGTNSGNLIYGAASHKLFSTEDTVVDATHYRMNGSMADQVNDEYDGVILPLANAFRPDFEDELHRTTDFLERLTIPFMMLSGGAQLPLDGDPAMLKRMEPTIIRFARAVLSGSSALTVRGEMTADYLRSLGFEDVVVVGCPSMTLHGPGHRVEVPESLPPGAEIAYNLETKDPFGAALITDAENRYRATYIAQEHGTLELMLWGADPYAGADPQLPLDRSHPQFTEGRAEMYLDAYPWIRRMSELSFSFGARAHGNIAAVLGGTPCVMLAHDSRTLELARYHGIPHVIHGQEHPSTVEELYAGADFGEFNRGHAERFEALSDVIHANGFTHIYDSGQEAALAEYEGRVAQMDYPPAVHPLWREESAAATRRHAVLQDREGRRRASQAAAKKDVIARHRQSLGEIARLTDRLVETEARLDDSRQAARDAERRAARAESAVTALAARVDGLTQELEEVGDRSRRALRVPASVRNLLARDRQGS